MHRSLLLLALSFLVSCAPTPGSENDFPPGKPSLSAQARHQSVQLSWPPVADAEAYLIYWSATAEGVRDLQDSSFVTKELAYQHEGLKNGQTYYYAVAAWKNIKGEKSATVAATPQSKPDTPQQVTAVAQDSEVALAWRQVPNATRYYVQTGIDSGVTPAIVAETTDPTFEARQLTNGTRYYFVVTASNDYGDSDASQRIYATPTSFLSLAAGDDHTCALKTDGSIWCWGGNTSSQLANGSTGITSQAQPSPIPDPRPSEKWQVLATGAKHNCAIKSDRSLWCWGLNESGQLGRGEIQPKFSAQPQQIEGDEWSTKSNALALGTAFSCALKTVTGDAHTLWCWGDNTDGQIGITPSSNKIPQPTKVGGEADWAAVFAGMNHVCGIKITGNLFCWGRNDYKQLGRGGDNPPAVSSQPVLVAELGPWIAASAGLNHTCAIKKDQSLWCWGNNDHGALGNGVVQRTTHPLPQRINAPGQNWSAVTAGRNHTCALNVTGNLWCWGGNIYGQLGNGVTVSQSLPIAADASLTLKAVAAGTHHTCGFTLKGQIYCWGYNAQEQLGDGQTLDPTRPVRVRTADEIQNVAVEKKDWQKVFAGGDQSCAIDETKALWCWGNNLPLISRNGTTVAAARPARKDLETGWNNVALGGSSSEDCGLKDGQRRCWKEGVWNIQQETPQWNALAKGGLHFCGLASGGSLYCWGRNDEGQLGNGLRGGTVKLPDATRVGTETDQWHSIAAHENYTCALKTNPDNPLQRTLWCWGENTKFSPPLNTLLPTEIDGDDWDTLALGRWHRCGIKSDQTLQCSGDDSYDKLKVPAIPTGTQWTAITAGSYHTCAVRGDNGQLLCWGLNDEGQLGNGTRGSNSSTTAAVMIGPDPLAVYSPTAIAAGNNHTCAINADRSLWCWGDNHAGQLGDGSAWKETPQLVSFPD